MKAIKTLNDLAEVADYSLMDKLKSDPYGREDGVDHDPREVFSVRKWFKLDTLG